MSKFYGMVQGNRGCATRGGSLNSGFRSSCQSYDGSIIVSMDYAQDNKTLMCRVGTSNRSSCSSDWNNNEFSGTFEEFKELLKLVQDIKSGAVKVVRHRKVR